MRTTFLIAGIAVLCMLGAVSDVRAGKIKALELREDDDIELGLDAPVLDGSSVAPLQFASFEEEFERGKELFRPRKPKFVGGNVRPDLPDDVDVGAFLAEAARREASLMGYNVADGGWVVGGTIRHLHMEYRGPSAWSFGALLYYGVMDLHVELTSPAGERFEEELRLLFYSPGGGGRNKTRVALERMIMASAQELLVRLNQLYFHAPASSRIVEVGKTLQASFLADEEGLVHAIGLAGYEPAVPLLLESLGVLEDEDDRAPVVLALARIRAPAALEILTRRYADESEDCRWYTLKALAYLGTPEALGFVREHGPESEEQSLGDLAENILR